MDANREGIQSAAQVERHTPGRCRAVWKCRWPVEAPGARQVVECGRLSHRFAAER